MGVAGFEISGNSASASVLHFGANSLSSYKVPISLRPFFGNALNARFTGKIRVSQTQKPNFGAVSASLNGGGSNVGLISDAILPKDSEFKPSFDEYLKAMESARTERGKKRAATARKQKTAEKGDNSTAKVSSARVKIERKNGHEGAEEGSSRSSGKVRRSATKGFRSENDGKENDLDVKGKQKNGSLKRQSHSLESKSKSIVRSSLNGSRGSVTKREVIHDLYSSKIVGEKVVGSRQRDYNTQGRIPDRALTQNVQDKGIVRRHSENGSFINRNGLSNVKMNGGRKRFIDRGYDSDISEVERAAFENLEDPNQVIRKSQFSHKEMEEKIQKLANSLNGADINLPEWIFSKMIRSARLKFSDYSITRIITILGKLGNWQRVIQVIEWLQKRERFKSTKLRNIYTAALVALGKSRRPVEALNIFHAMQQQMSSYPDLVAYQSIAVTLGQAGHMKELFDVIDIMRSPPKKKFKTGVFKSWDPRLEPDIVVYHSVLNACVKQKQWEGAFWVLQQLKKQGQQPSATTYGLVMEVMLSCGKYNLVHEFFRKLQKSFVPNSLTYRVLVNTLWKEGKSDEAILAVQEMENRGIVGSASLYYDLARCLCAAGRSHEALKQIDKICKVANKPLVVTYTGLMQASLDSGNIQDGAYIFEKMKEVCAPNLVTYNILLKSYLEHGMFQEAKALFEQMSENANCLRGNTDYKMLVVPDTYTFNTMLDACVSEQRWDYFDHVYQKMLYHGYHFNPKRHLQMILDASRAGKPFFVLHKASSRKKDRTPTAQAKLCKTNELSSSPESVKKLGGSMTEGCDLHLFQQLQIEAFDIVWEKIESTIKGVLRDLNANVFNNIQQWVLECFNTTKLLGQHTIAEATRSFPVLNNTTPGQLFTAFIVTRNIEFVDDMLTFEELGHFLKSHGCHVAKLSSLEFSLKNGIAGCLKALLREFVGCVIDSADISILASWYREHVNYNKPLVLIINDLGRCSGSVLTDFILMLSEWIVKVPIIFIFGVATTVDTPRNILPSHALERLCPSSFMLGTPAERMDAIVEAVLVKHCTMFSIGHKVAVFLRNYFINQDGTITSFIRALKVACLLHFSMEPLSLIHGRALAEDHKEGKSAVSPETLLKYIDQLPLHARNQIADHHTKKSTAEGLSELVTMQKLWSTAVLCLYEAGKYSRVRLLDLFCEALSQDLYLSTGPDCHVGNERYCGLSSTNDSSQQYSIMQSGGYIGQIVRNVRDLPAGMLYQLIENWEKLTADISEIHEKLKVLQSSLRCEDGKSPRKSSKDNPKRYASRISVNTDKDARMLNSQAIAFLNCLVGNFLKPIEGKPFHEILCFKNVEKLQLVLIGDPRRRIQVDLLEFHKILRCSCCSKNGNALLPSRHDSSIMYSLAQEHGDLINLHDWFQSFRSIVLQNKNKRKQNTKQSPQPKKRKAINGSADQNEASIQARFCKAVTELQITGLVRMPSKRRPDFAQRIAFGL